MHDSAESVVESFLSSGEPKSEISMCKQLEWSTLHLVIAIMLYGFK